MNMAQRLAMEYVNVTMQMTEFQLNQFLLSADTSYISHRVKILGAGEQEIVLEEAGGEEVHLSFERKGGIYIGSLSCRVVNPHLINMIRKLFFTYKGTGTVNRIYKDLTMMYYYEGGSVRRISEVRPGGTKLIYEHKYSLVEMMSLFKLQTVEQEIELIHQKINSLLDLRNTCRHEAAIREVDDELAKAAARLFQLEA
ncbi:non-ribosomal peptide synthetase module [Paenibacillus sp. MMS20-IR301]|uniref:non-ribosomal peptide synthetase module n=1 Tax=Paenibacillus sp. MMS20-IR301 TaxID=2895946 RepID=UPI0028EFE55D|nr:non-ribosomal peptide synthetase module [Paenibacillus sp. MMS20-IR301]WNS43515.1 non-ribosomal peptide synthetase module [Paenibacillus sp. MMS20-IR301]